MVGIRIGKSARNVTVAMLAACGAGLPAAALSMDADSPADQPSQGAANAPKLLIDENAIVNVDDTPVVRLGPPDAYEGVDLYAMRGYFAPVGKGPAAHGSMVVGASGDALTCLAQAVYFEARSESTEGQEAVAQVVINRTRMANYPHSVCGVVYQGGERSTGCQFTFVCDGSMSRPIEPAAWGRALAIANQALSGFVYQPMVDAAHYHASWMTPYWSSSVEKIRQIGGHIFYR